MSKPPPFEVRKPRDRIASLKILIYGATGAGKTKLIGTAAEDKDARFGRVLLLAPDPGDLTLAHLEVDNLDVKDIRNFDNDFSEAYEYLDSSDNQYGMVAIDGLTDAQQLSMSGVMQRTLETNPDRDPDLPGLDQWGKNVNQVRRIVRAYRDLPMHVVMTALATEVKDERTGQMFVRPALSGKLAGEVGAYFDIVIYIYTKMVDDPAAKSGKRIQRIARCQPTDRILAKDRTRKLGIEVEDPTLPMLLDLILGDGPLAEAPAQDVEVKKAKVAMGKK